MSNSVEAHVVAAFVDARDGGNLAGVVFDRPDLTEAQMQSVAARLGFSETAFLTEVADGFRFDVFTPTTRVADCGHATIASFGLLAQRGRFATDTIKHTIVGPRAIRVDADGQVFMQQRPAAFEAGPEPQRIAASLGLAETTAFASPPMVARHDVAFLVVPLPQRGMLAALIPNMRAIAAISVTLDVFGYYVFAESGVPDVAATIRMFAPQIGIPEESATGMAAGLLAAFMHDRLAAPADAFVFEQGVFMHPPSPSRLVARLEYDGGAIANVWVGGNARSRGARVIQA